MKFLLAVFTVLLPLSPATAAAQDSTSVSIRPGSFSTTLTVIDGVAVLTVLDATGSGNGWWVTVECTCSWVPSGAIQSASEDAGQTPHWTGTTLVAGPDQGMGIFEQTLLAAPGQWLVSSGQTVQP
jgi:hypothetical protein